MKTSCLLIFILGLSMLVLTCSDDDEDRGAMKRNLQGSWVEVYNLDVNKPNGMVDSIHSTVLTFSGSSFTSSLYLDSFQQFLDTVFTGSFDAAGDSLYLYPGNWSEVYYAPFLSNGSLLIAPIYSHDASGYTVGDFEPVIWCSNVKKRGVFVRY